MGDTQSRLLGGNGSQVAWSGKHRAVEAAPGGGLSFSNVGPQGTQRPPNRQEEVCKGKRRHTQGSWPRAETKPVLDIILQGGLWGAEPTQHTRSSFLPNLFCGRMVVWSIKQGYAETGSMGGGSLLSSLVSHGEASTIQSQL